MSLLMVDKLHASVQGEEILTGLDIAVNPGEVHAIMGPNGSGKSTLANVLAGRPGYEGTSGTVNLDGVNLLDLEPHERAHQGVSALRE